MRRPCVAGNWKMHMTVEQSLALVKELRPGLVEFTTVDSVICPPFTALAKVAELLEETDISLGAQNLFWAEKGAFTGEISPLMVAELADHVIIGHSERRAYFQDTDKAVNKKIKAALLLCVVVHVHLLLAPSASTLLPLLLLFHCCCACHVSIHLFHPKECIWKAMLL